MDTRTKQSLRRHTTTMEYPQNEMSCTLSLISSDLENFETVEELYFGERENDEEADDSPLDESSSESEDDGKTRTCIDFADADL